MRVQDQHQHPHQDLRNEAVRRAADSGMPGPEEHADGFHGSSNVDQGGLDDKAMHRKIHGVDDGQLAVSGLGVVCDDAVTT